ncbi:MAG: ubiquitin-like domain-containing protein, partial [Waddliaceae bacterium]
MNIKKTSLVGFLAILIGISSSLVGNNILINVPNDVILDLNIPEKASIKMLKKRLERVTGFPKREQVLISEGRVFRNCERLYPYEGQEFWLELKANAQEIEKQMINKTYPGYRNYHKSLTPEEKKNLCYILKSLSQKSIPSLLSNKKQIENAGKRIDHVHPLKFLECVFTDEELKAYIHNIKKRGGMVWREFMKDFAGTLQAEFDIGNIKDPFLYEFANRVGIDISRIYFLAHACKWEEFVKA